ncbi:MAG: glycine--tRNA ligase [Candidatus Omnitrophota bacterium]
MDTDKLTKIVSMCRRRGFIFGGSEIYGGLSSVWDYGPFGAKIKKRIKDLWWDHYVEKRDDIVGLDSSIIMHEDVFKASGHLAGFTDSLVDCPKCKKRSRVDMLEKEDTTHYICECKNVIDITVNKPRKFNLMFKTNVSATEENPVYAYLRPETAQGIFVNFANVLNTVHKKLPLGIAQIGKSFRNEVTTGSFIFRMKEFEQMEIEYFVHPNDADKMYEYWVKERYSFYTDKIGLKKENLRLRPHTADELAHYARGCTDVEYMFPFGWSELEGIANRTDFDLKQHSEVSRKDLSCFSSAENKKFIPYVIEPSAGVDRTFFAIICDAYDEETVNDRTRVVLRLKPYFAPYRAAVFPLLKKNDELVNIAKNLFYDIRNKMPATYEDTAGIGKLYRRQDEIGTPFCITIDGDSLKDQKVTIRDRDTMLQERVSIDQGGIYIEQKSI